ncbi:hypothetical protein F5Y05DRAFT_410693 [Hypoxylon sp. FL0543]|nr:hypothetical protein F5Y05DRAFT_410693 [Hypoxylon sp. FL0543]
MRPFQSPNPPEDNIEDIACVACLEIPRRLRRLPCGCTLCRDCLIQFFEVGLRERSTWPPRCHGQPTTEDDVAWTQSGDLLERYREVGHAHNLKDPLWCAQPRCSALLLEENVMDDGKDAVTCHKCKFTTCKKCKKAHNPKETECKDSDSDADLEIIALDEGWRRCPHCASAAISSAINAAQNGEPANAQGKTSWTKALAGMYSNCRKHGTKSRGDFLIITGIICNKVRTEIVQMRHAGLPRQCPSHGHARKDEYMMNRTQSLYKLPPSNSIQLLGTGGQCLARKDMGHPRRATIQYLLHTRTVRSQDDHGNPELRCHRGKIPLLPPGFCNRHADRRRHRGGGHWPRQRKSTRHRLKHREGSRLFVRILIPTIRERLIVPPTVPVLQLHLLPVGVGVGVGVAPDDQGRREGMGRCITVRVARFLFDFWLASIVSCIHIRASEFLL